MQNLLIYEKLTVLEKPVVPFKIEKLLHIIFAQTRLLNEGMRTSCSV